MAINRINETDLRDKLVSQLSNRPTDPRSAGGDNMTAQQVKERHDALGLLVKEKLNELIDALNNATIDGEPVTPLSDLITVVADGVSKSLTEWIEAKLTKGVTAGEGVHAYGVDNDGEQTMLPVSDAATEGAIPQYGTGGVLPVADGTEDGHAMNKGQVDALVDALTAAIAAKYTKPDGGIPLTDLASSVSAIISDALKWSNADASATPFKVPIRDGTGVVHGATYGASAPSTALVNKEQFEPVKALAEGASQAAAAENYSALVGILSEAPKTKYKAGQRFLIGTYGVPDVGVLSVEDTAVSYTYTTDAAFEASLMAGTLQIGYFVLRPVEGKTNLEDYSTTAETNEAISDAIDLLVDALVDGVMSVAEANYAESATYAQQAAFANQINTDREIEDADTACPPVVFGTVGGNAEVQSGLMKFPELRGHTIKFNQLCKDPTFANSNQWAADDTTVSNNKAVMTGTGRQSQNIQSQYVTNEFPLVYGHTYLIALKVTTTAATTNTNMRLYDGSAVSYPFAGALSVGTTYIKAIHKFVKTSTQNGCFFFYPNLVETGFPVGETMTLENLQIIDLTEIYGEGNEPSTGAEFVRDFPMPVYQYNAGTLLSSKSSSVDFVKRNQWDEEWESGAYAVATGEKHADANKIRCKNLIRVLPSTVYYKSAPSTVYWQLFYDANGNYISYSGGEGTFTTPANACFMAFYCENGYGTTYNHDICIYVNWETPNLPYVPYSKQHITLPNLELRSAGTAYDVLYQQGGGKRRIGEYVFTGSETWTASSGHAYYSNAITTLVKAPSSNDDVANILCDALDATSSNDLYSNGDTNRGIAINTGGYIWIDETTYANIASLTGKTLYYELATETDITVEENPGWDEYAEIDNFGTVKFNQSPAQTIPVPQAYFVRYVVNLVEFLDSLFVHCGGDVSKLALVE